MRRLFLLTVSSVISSISTLGALPVGNPIAPTIYSSGLWEEQMCCVDSCLANWYNLLHFRLGYYGDYVFDRHTEMYVDGDRTGDVDKTVVVTNAGMLVFDFCNWIEVFGTLGVTNLSFATEAKEAQLYALFEYSPQLSWSVGARAVLWEGCGFGLGLDGQYFRFTPLLNQFENRVTGEVLYFNNNNRMTYSEWQGGLGLTYNFESCSAGMFTPYAAVTAAGGVLDNGNFVFSDNITQYTLSELKPKRIWGYALGLTWSLCNTMGMSIEGRFADEKAVYVDGQISF
ncbi:MAG: hypothetical protein ACKVOH_01660 [Chlamydiales bacterium]